MLSCLDGAICSKGYSGMALVVGAVIDYQCHENPHRIDEAEPGYGFGLPITREIADLHGRDRQ